jgi:hypothetical protein
MRRKMRVESALCGFVGIPGLLVCVGPLASAEFAGAQTVPPQWDIIGNWGIEYSVEDGIGGTSFTVLKENFENGSFEAQDDNFGELFSGAITNGYYINFTDYQPGNVLSIEGTISTVGTITVGQMSGPMDQTNGGTDWHGSFWTVSGTAAPICAFSSTTNGLWDVDTNWAGGSPPSSESAVVISDGTVPVTGPASSATISSLILGGGSGSGTLSLQPAGNLAITNNLIVNSNGTLNTVAANVTAASVTNVGGDIEIANETSMTVNGSFLQTAGATQVAGSLVIDSNNMVIEGGSLDLIATGTVTINYAGSVDPLSQIQAYLTAGYNADWNGVDISSSTVVSLNATEGGLVYSIGYVDGADSLTGVPSGEIEVTPTLAGDATLQGGVAFGDFQLLAEYFGQSGTSWDEGDFTYNGTTNFGDFQLLAQDFGANSSGLTESEMASLNSFAARFGDELVPNASGVGFRLVAVPEPASLAFLAAAGLGTLARRKRRNIRYVCR